MIFAYLAVTPPPSSGPSAGTIFYLTLVFIFLTAIITTVATKWTRDKCLKFFNSYHVTLERTRGQTSWGQLRVLSSGIEVLYDNPYRDVRGHEKTSYMLYQQDMDAQLLAVFRYQHELSEPAQRRRKQQVQKTFNPGAVRRFFRKIRNFVNTLRDAFNAAIGTVIGQYQKMNPTSTVLSTQGNQVTQIGQTLLGKFANAYEPLLEQYIGQPVILETLDPTNPNNVVNEYPGYLADYTQNFVAVFNVEHKVSQRFELMLPDVEEGDKLPPAPAAPPAGAPPAPAPPALKEENGLSVRIDGARLRIVNVQKDLIVVRELQREGFQPLRLGMVIPPSGELDLPARDARGGKLVLDRAQCMDIIASRKFATIRHAGILLPRPGLVDELVLPQLPLVPWRNAGADQPPGAGEAANPKPQSTRSPSRRG